MRKIVKPEILTSMSPPEKMWRLKGLKSFILKILSLDIPLWKPE
jgi:hypothetical protein